MELEELLRFARSKYSARRWKKKIFQFDEMMNFYQSLSEKTHESPESLTVFEKMFMLIWRHHNKSSERIIRSHSKKQSQTSRATRFTTPSHEKAPETLINDNPSYFAQYAIKRDFVSPFEFSWCGHYSNDLIPIAHASHCSCVKSLCIITVMRPWIRSCAREQKLSDKFQFLETLKAIFMLHLRAVLWFRFLTRCEC